MSKTIGKILGILLSISVIVTGLCMIIQCLSIYNSGDKPYTRESVAKAFGEISVPVFICLALVIITFVYNFFVHASHSSVINIKNYRFTIKAIISRKHIDTANDLSINKEHKLRRTHCLILSVLLVAGLGYFFIYALNPTNYHQSEINSSIINAMTVFCICILAPFIYSVICIFIIDRSRCREIKILRELAKEAPVATTENTDNQHKALLYVKISAIILCICIILFGLFSGGTADVLTKAVNICTECIGLG